MNCVSIRGDGVTTRENNVAHISLLLIGFLGAEDPFIAAFQAEFGIL
jgi:hypothetical protein